MRRNWKNMMHKENITKKEALDLIRSAWTPASVTEEVAVADAMGRILAEDCHAKYDLPVVRAAGMDGICVNFDLFENGMPDTSEWQRGVQYDRADTGDDFPDAFDTVLPIEWVKTEDGTIRIEPQKMHGPGGRPDGAPQIERGMNVRPAGSMMKKDALLAKKGMRITAFDIAALATGGYGTVKVIKKPRIAFLPTGSELIPAGSIPQRGQNFDANSLMVSAMLREMGAEVTCFPIEADHKNNLKERLAEALKKNDIVLINGGSSKGEEDFNTRILQEMGEFLFHWIKAAPGRPMSAAVIQGKLVINLAGPTIGAYYGVIWCVKELLADWYGCEVPWGHEIEAELTEDLMAPPMSIFMRMRVTDEKEESEKARYFASRIGGGPGRTHPGINQPDANAIYMTEPDQPAPKKGDVIRVIMVR
ncbi:MAG: molybdopterin molybdotransferase MoeA [Lachnospiraceae bacterium]|nr:molybdopterin molybdotransferase MoeA [Lachnospiraceae bacterium]